MRDVFNFLEENRLSLSNLFSYCFESHINVERVQKAREKRLGQENKLHAVGFTGLSGSSGPENSLRYEVGDDSFWQTRREISPNSDMSVVEFTDLAEDTLSPRIGSMGLN